MRHALPLQHSFTFSTKAVQLCESLRKVKGCNNVLPLRSGSPRGYAMKTSPRVPHNRRVARRTVVAVLALTKHISLYTGGNVSQTCPKPQAQYCRSFKSQSAGGGKGARGAARKRTTKAAKVSVLGHPLHQRTFAPLRQQASLAHRLRLRCSTHEV